ncbi:adenylate/guanylate cyclase domain-containing protein [Mycolicibacterium fortuitum]|uniref:adenylate/guanylate cyclase domain-containing protein n=1 Tax=Mycolicibacterium fortuitum TaxID=1766 RepID=UPI00148F7D3B|nr:YHS domain-containing protein [Mycolicibacterium fortuitum]
MDRSRDCDRISDPVKAAVLFLDLAGFSALTEAHGDHEAAELAEDFAELTRAALGEGDRLVKTIGDGLMVTSPTPRSALQLVGRVAELTARAGGYPMLRVGMNWGPVVRSSTDVYGGTVNVAARIAAIANADEVLATGAVASVAAGEGLAVRPMGSVTLRNIAMPVDLFSVEGLMRPLMGEWVDPVCRMRLADSTGRPRSRAAGRDYRFCSLVCVQRFEARPHDFLAAAADARIEA